MNAKEKRQMLKWVNSFANAKTVTTSDKPKKEKKNETNKKKRVRVS